MGKTRIVQKFLREHRSSFDDVTGRTRLPVVAVQMPPAPSEREALFADDDPCAQAILDLQIQRIGAVYDLSAVPSADFPWQLPGRARWPD
jgi:hypothetical protein